MLNIEYQQKLSESDNDLIIRQLEKQSQVKKGIENKIETFAFTLKDNQSDFIGAISGFSYYECLHISLLFIEESNRGKNYGKKLLQKAEHLAQERKCKMVTVNSMDWEAHEYYLKLGYSIDHIQSGYSKDSKKYFLKKTLN